MMIAVDIIIFLIALLIIITIHEFGHFFVAKLAKVLCHEFAIGFGFYLFSVKKPGRETRFSLKGIPFGGYAAMAGEDEASSYIKKGESIGLVLDEKKYVTHLVLGKKEATVRGIVKYFNVYNDDKDLYITIDCDGKLLKYLLRSNAEYVFDKGHNQQNAPKSRSFEAKPKMARFLILFGGPMMNFVLAIFLFMFAALISGKPVITNKVGKNKIISTETINIPKGSKITSLKVNDILKIENNNGLLINEVQSFVQKNPCQSYEIIYEDVKTNSVKNILVYSQITLVNLGISNEGKETNTDGVVIGKIIKGLNRKISKNDKIIKVGIRPSINAEPTWHIVNNWQDLINHLQPNKLNQVDLAWVKPDKDGNFVVNDENIKTDTFKLISKDTLQGQGIGTHYVINIGINGQNKFDLAYAINRGFHGTWDVTKKTFMTLKALFDGNSNVGVTDLSGPVGIFQIVSKARENGFASILILVAFISVNIGILNLLPIPALDGGRIAFLAVEAIAGRKISKKFETKVNVIAFIMLLALMIVVLGLDIFKLVIH